MILLIDNYDSFSYNLYQLVGTLNPDIRVVRNDKITLPEIEKMNPSHIILSPGPGNRRMLVSAKTVLRILPEKSPF